MTSTTTLFQPITVGTMQLQHRIIMAPTTRFRARKGTHVPALPIVKEYYEQRSRTPGTFIITEGVFIAERAGGYVNVPGIWSEEQINAWKEVTDAVHANGSFIYLQLWALGRAACPEDIALESLTLVSPSPIPLSYQPTPVPKQLTEEEIGEYIELYSQAATNAVHKAGFDGVELHSANGFLLDTFLHETSNQRTDRYGGSVENRSRFVLEALDAVTAAVGEERTGIRLTPYNAYQEMTLDDPKPQFTQLISTVKAAHPSLAYLHVTEPRLDGNEEQDGSIHKVARSHGESNDFVREIWSPKPLIVAGVFARESAINRAEETGDLIAFGRKYIANPDLPLRLMNNLPLNRPDRSTFYVAGDRDDAAVGYTDYPFAST